MAYNDWRPDPYGRFAYRWFKDGAPTDAVSDGVVDSVDPINAPPSMDRPLPHPTANTPLAPLPQGTPYVTANNQDSPSSTQTTRNWIVLAACSLVVVLVAAGVVVAVSGSRTPPQQPSTVQIPASVAAPEVSKPVADANFSIKSAGSEYRVDGRMLFDEPEPGSEGVADVAAACDVPNDDSTVFVPIRVEFELVPRSSKGDAAVGRPTNAIVGMTTKDNEFVAVLTGTGSYTCGGAKSTFQWNDVAPKGNLQKHIEVGYFVSTNGRTPDDTSRVATRFPLVDPIASAEGMRTPNAEWHGSRVVGCDGPSLGGPMLSPLKVPPFVVTLSASTGREEIRAPCTAQP